MSARVWDRRRADMRMARAIKRGLDVVREHPFAVVPLPGGELVLIGMDYYDRLQRLAAAEYGFVIDDVDQAILRKVG